MQVGRCMQAHTHVRRGRVRQRQGVYMFGLHLRCVRLGWGRGCACVGLVIVSAPVHVCSWPICRNSCTQCSQIASAFVSSSLPDYCCCFSAAAAPLRASSKASSLLSFCPCIQLFLYQNSLCCILLLNLCNHHQGIFQGLYFGVGQGLGALIGGLLKQRHGGQAMFALCSCIVLAGWLLCVVAEQATAQFSKAGQQDVISSSNDRSSSRRSWWQQIGRSVHVLVCKLRWMHVPSSSSEVGGGVLAATAARAQLRQQKYAELASKDSGPDLQHHLQGFVVSADDRAGV
jgi:hypothetical protein